MRHHASLRTRRSLLCAAAGAAFTGLWPVKNKALAAEEPNAPPAAPAAGAAPNLFGAAQTTPGAIIRVPGGRYDVTKTIEILDGQTWIFEGAAFVYNGTGPAFRARANDWTMQGRCRLFGAGIDVPGNAGMVIDRGRAFHMRDMEFVGFGGVALQLVDDANLFAKPRSDRGTFTDLTFVKCDTGIDVQAGAEYSLFGNTSVRGCKRGIIVTGGNTQFFGGNVVDCEDGIILSAGKNDSHGGFHAFNINHSTRYSVFANGISNGHIFNGCNFFADGPTSGAIYLKDSAGVMIQSGQIDCQVIVEGRKGHNLVVNNLVAGKNFSITGDRTRLTCRGNVRMDGSDACRS